VILFVNSFVAYSTYRKVGFQGLLGGHSVSFHAQGGIKYCQVISGRFLSKLFLKISNDEDFAALCAICLNTEVVLDMKKIFATIFC